MLLEPQGRNTGPCVAWATATVRRRDPRAVMVVLAADAYIPDQAAFLAAQRPAPAAAQARATSPLGIRPNRAETGYRFPRRPPSPPASPRRVRGLRARGARVRS